MNGKIDPVSVIKSEVNPVVASSIGVGDNSRVDYNQAIIRL